MKWVTVGRAHWNADHIEAFFWAAGQLVVYWHDREENNVESYKDPDRALYIRLCRAVGLAPVEVVSDGEG